VFAIFNMNAHVYFLFGSLVIDVILDV